MPPSNLSTETVIIGAGQAGLALSHELTAAGHDHAVLERGRIGERWRSERRASLRLLTPNWINRLPGSPPHADADAFLSVAEFAAYLERYARLFGAPVREHSAVHRVERSGRGYRIATAHGVWTARNVVIATGDCDLPRIPAVAAGAPSGLHALTAASYRSPGSLPPGGVLVVGAGASGQQIALELSRAGRSVILAVGRHARAPRRYRGRDIFGWLRDVGEFDKTLQEMGDPVAARRVPTLPLSGASGGARIDLGVLAGEGVVVTGRLEGFSGTHAHFAGDLASSVADADRRMRAMLARIDAHIASLPPSARAPVAEPLPPVVPPRPLASVDLHDAGVTTIVWATGYRRTYPWLRVPVIGADGELVHSGGVTPAPGLAVLGLRFQRRRASHFIGGVGADARILAAKLTGAEAARGLPLVA